jgi:hypothetical protein
LVGRWGWRGGGWRGGGEGRGRVRAYRWSCRQARPAPAPNRTECRTASRAAAAAAAFFLCPADGFWSAAAEAAGFPAPPPPAAGSGEGPESVASESVLGGELQGGPRQRGRGLRGASAEAARRRGGGASKACLLNTAGRRYRQNVTEAASTTGAAGRGARHRVRHIASHHQFESPPNPAAIRSRIWTCGDCTSAGPLVATDSTSPPSRGCSVHCRSSHSSRDHPVTRPPSQPCGPPPVARMRDPARAFVRVACV